MTVAQYLRLARDAGFPARGSRGHRDGFVPSWPVNGEMHTLGGDLAWWATTSPGAAWLVELMRQRDGAAPVHPDTVLDVLAVIGLDGSTPLLDLYEAAGAIKCRADAYRALVAPELVLDTSRWRYPSASDWAARFAEQHPLHASDIQSISFDPTVPDIPTADAEAILAWWRITSAGMRYVPEGQQGRGGDCDDWACALRGRLAMLGYGGVAAIIRTQTHAFNMFSIDGVLQIIEPQDATKHPPGYAGLITGRVF